jgi:hypothetical protein
VAAADPTLLVFEIGDVLGRVEGHGDLFADVLTTRQHLGHLPRS